MYSSVHTGGDFHLIINLFVGIKVDPKVKFGGDGLTYKARVS